MIAKELGERIKELRKKAGLSQEKFALKIDMDRTYFATVESGKRNISLQNIEKIAKGLNVSLSELFEGIGETNDDRNGIEDQGNSVRRIWKTDKEH